VVVAGAGAVAARLVDLLTEAGAGCVTALRESWPPASDVDLLIACAGWIPDARWQRLDAWCAARGIPWHRVHQEGAALHLGPLSIPGVTASYADSRARRLAAASYPEELEALWQFRRSWRRTRWRSSPGGRPRRSAMRWSFPSRASP
jgi:hypothetical protein